MFGFRFNNVCLQSFAVHLPPNEITSAQIEDQLGALYKKLGIPFGTLEKLSGVKSRYLWNPGTRPSQVATEACRVVMQKSGINKTDIGLLLNCSITRDYFEPATAILVHSNLGLAESTMAFDITNACMGFLNGVLTASNMIESGMIKSALVVSGETIERPLEACVKYILENPNIGREELLKLVPTFTLGSGAVAYLLTHKSLDSSAHKILGGTTRSASQFSDLCIGNGDYFTEQVEDFNPIMTTESAKLISSAATLGARTWKDTATLLDWVKQDINHIFCHQVGKQVNKAFYAEIGVDIEKEYTIYPKYGNLASAALPSALALGSEEKPLKAGEKILLMGFGSGLNSLFLGLEW